MMEREDWVVQRAVVANLPGHLVPELITTLIWQLRSAAYDAATGRPNEEQAIADRLYAVIAAAISEEREMS